MMIKISSSWVLRQFGWKTPPPYVRASPKLWLQWWWRFNGGKNMKETRLYSYYIGPAAYVWKRIKCAFTGHEWRFNGGNPACSKCWLKMTRKMT